MNDPILQLYYWTTPNGHKIVIFLEEVGAPYKLIPVNISAGEQFQPEFLAISPNNRIPAIVDPAPAFGGGALSLFESGAILEYLADKYGRFLPQSGAARYRTLQWLYWQMAGLGPMAGQNHHFVQYAPERIPYAMDRYVNETSRLYCVLNQQLKAREFITGELSIADMAAYPWVRGHEGQQQDIDEFPHVKAWLQRMTGRESVGKAYQIAKDLKTPATVSEESKIILFGQNAQTLRQRANYR